MNILTGLGHAAGGFARGALFAEHIDDMKQRREDRKKMEDIWKAGQDAAKEAEDKQISLFTQPVQQIGLDTVPTNIDYTSGAGVMAEQQPIQQAQAYPDYTPQKFADGGIVQDPNAFVSQVEATPQPAQALGLSSINPTQQPAQQTAQKPKINPGKVMSRAFSAMTNKALELGRPDLAMQYQQAGFKMRDNMFKQSLPGAMQKFKMTGDIGGLVDLYDSVDDGIDVDGYEKTANGYKIRAKDSSGNMFEQEYTPDQIQEMVMGYTDPAARWKAELDAKQKMAFERFKTDEEIRKQKEVEDGKVHTVGLDSIAYKNDGTILYDGSKREKPDAWKSNIQSVSGGYIQKNPDGSETFVSTNGKGGNGSGTGKAPKDWNKDMLPVLKDVNDSILGFEGMGTQDINTGKVTPTKQGNEAMVFGQRLLKQNPELLPADVAKLAHLAATDPNATDYQVLERRDGTRYKRQVIKYGGQIYQLANTAGSDIKETQAEKPRQATPKQPQQNPPSKPLPATINSAPGLDSVTINKTSPQSFQFRDQIPSSQQPFDADSARQAMGTGRKDWYERKPDKTSSVGLDSLIFLD